MRKTVLINNTNMKKCRKILLEAIFFTFEKTFQSFHTKFLSLLYMISLACKISHFLSANHNPELRCVICTGVTVFALVLHLNCTALSQSQSSNFLCVLLVLVYCSISISISIIANIQFSVALAASWSQFQNLHCF